VANTAQLLNAVAGLKPRSEAVVGVQRGEKTLQLKVQVAQRPPPQRNAVDRLDEEDE
jgi:serine protease DegQ